MDAIRIDLSIVPSQVRRVMSISTHRLIMLSDAGVRIIQTALLKVMLIVIVSTLLDDSSLGLRLILVEEVVH